MSTYVPNIGSVKPYEAESLDARFKRRRDEGQGSQDFASDDDLDATDQESGQILSVQALILFLEDFLESRLGSKLRKNPPQEPNAFDQWFRKKPGNCNEASQAYKQGAKTAKSKARSLTQKQDDMDLSHVYGLIRHLRDLKQSNVHVLRLSPDTDFMNGIALAVAQAQRDLRA